MPGTLSQCLSQYKVSDLPLPQQLVTLQHPKQTLFDAIQVLADKHLLSAPVLDADGKLIGMLDTLDIVAYVTDAASHGASELADHAIDTLIGKGCHRRARPVALVKMEDGLEAVTDTIAGPSRRAVVLNSNGVPESVVTQSTVVKFLHSKKQEIKAMNCGTAAEHCSHGTVTIGERETALKAFETINDLEISCLAILGDDGRMLTVISATDLVVGLARMRLKPQIIACLKSMTVTEFVSENRRLDVHAKAATVAVSPKTPLAEVIEMLAVTRVHQVIIMGENHTPLGVIALSDICRAVANPGRLA